MTAAYRQADADTIRALRDVGIAQERARVDTTLMTFHVCRLMAHLEVAVRTFVEGLRNTDNQKGTVLSDESLGVKVVPNGGLAVLGGAAYLGKTYRTKICDLLVSVHARIVSCASRISPPPPHTHTHTRTCAHRTLSHSRTRSHVHFRRRRSTGPAGCAAGSSTHSLTRTRRSLLLNLTWIEAKVT